MASVKGLYTRVKCTACKAWTEVSVSARRVSIELDALQESDDWKCAECTSGAVNPFTTPLDDPKMQEMIEDTASVWEKKR